MFYWKNSRNMLSWKPDRDARILPYGNSMTTATGYSFPSGHTMNAATVFGGMGLRKDFSRARRDRASGLLGGLPDPQSADQNLDSRGGGHRSFLLPPDAVCGLPLPLVRKADGRDLRRGRSVNSGAEGAGFVPGIPSVSGFGGSGRIRF